MHISRSQTKAMQTVNFILSRLGYQWPFQEMERQAQSTTDITYCLLSGSYSEHRGPNFEDEIFPDNLCMWVHLLWVRRKYWIAVSAEIQCPDKQTDSASHPDHRFYRFKWNENGGIEEVFEVAVNNWEDYFNFQRDTTSYPGDWWPFKIEDSAKS